MIDRPPPRLVRLLLVTPIVFVCALALTIASPAIHVLAAIVDLLFDRRRWRASRFVGIGLAFCAAEVFGLFALLTVWVGSGFGLFMDRPFWVKANTVLTGQYMEMITRAIRFFLGFGFSYTYESMPGGSQVLFARHAGPGDAFLIARVLIRDLGRKIHMVGASKLQWDPFLDIAGQRLGFHYLQPHSSDAGADLDKIRAIALNLRSDETLVIFPEGGNFTDVRRARSIERLEASGRHDHAERAAQLRHTLLPRVGGVHAALDGAPTATVVFLAHVGLEGLHGFGDLWSSVPLDRSVSAHAWSAAAEDRPKSPVERTTWLFDQWTAVDEWIESNVSTGR